MVAHTRAALEQLQAQLVLWAQGVRSDVRVVIETAQALVVDWLSTTGFTVCPLNPKVADAPRKLSGAKTDRLGAAILARLGWQEAETLRPLAPSDETWSAWRPLTSLDVPLIQEHTRLVNPWAALLKSDYPVVLLWFDDLNRPTARAFLAQWAAPRDSHALSVSPRPRWLRPQRYPNAEAAAAQRHAPLQAAALAPRPDQARAQIRGVRTLVAPLQALESHRRALRDQIDAPFRAHADQARGVSVPGGGPLIGARLVAAWREDRDRFASAEAVQALVGTSPVAYQSGMLGRIHLCRACDESFRQALHRLAFASLRPCGWARADSAVHRARGCGHPAVLRAWANRRVQMLFGMWNDQAPYFRPQFWAAQARHRTA